MSPSTASYSWFADALGRSQHPTAGTHGLFRSAADLALDRVRDCDMALVVLVDGSPTCGTSHVQDGSFRGGTVRGRGLAAERLRRARGPVPARTELPQAVALLARLGPGSDPSPAGS
jgi:uncharacterized protein YbbK (DUF523 family)